MLIVESESTIEDYALNAYRDKNYKNRFEIKHFIKDTPEQDNYSEIPF